ncbi:dihydrofolate reductase family protein [Polaromonas sp.]|uniref:dihydrofolate reductase family protein n=1 Tax=Polaromonas sp. TaxID=1869339 RepID=UPI003C9C0539
MRKLIASTFVSLDGVMQAPGGLTEDSSGGFTLGGWMFAFLDAEVDLSAAGFDGKNRELVLGRRTYDIFAAYWPHQPADNPIATIFNAAKKHVASRTLKSLEWNHSSVLDGDVVSALTALKAQPGLDLQIIGSGNLIQTLQAASLIDEYHVWTYPVVLGHGKRLFESGAKPGALRVVDSKVSKTGVVMSTYVPAGEIVLGTIGEAEPAARN